MSRFFFFFQAEDGIRDLTVTGVQTCALPIFDVAPYRHEARAVRTPAVGLVGQAIGDGGEGYRHGSLTAPGRADRGSAADRRRSEERRVGKECRSRWGRDHERRKASVTGWQA